MQGPQTNIVPKNDKVNAFMEKLELWEGNIEATFVTCFLHLKHVPEMKWKLTKAYHQPLGCFAETVFIVF
jgi:hypothetical protein